MMNMEYMPNTWFRFSVCLSLASLGTATWEYTDVCRYYFGSFGQWSSLIFSLVSLIGAMIVYWVLMSNFLFNTGKFIYSKYSLSDALNTITFKYSYDCNVFMSAFRSRSGINKAREKKGTPLILDNVLDSVGFL